MTRLEYVQAFREHVAKLPPSKKRSAQLASLKYIIKQMKKRA